MRLLDKKCSSNAEDGPVVIDTKETFEEFLSNVISIVVLGKGIVYGEKNGVYEIAKIIEGDLTGIGGGMRLTLITHFPHLSEFLGIKLFSGEIYDFLREHVIEEIERRRRRKVDNRHDFVQFLMNSTSHLDETTISAQVLSFFVSGFSVVSKLFQACCYELAKNEEIQDGLFKEIENDFELDDKHNKFLDKIILEALRKWPPIPYLNRVCGENCTIEAKSGEKYKFFKGDSIKIPLRLVQNDHELFDDPNYFNPQRFDDTGDLNSINSIFPFGLGARACCCSEIAICQVKALLRALVRKYIIYCQKTPDECPFSSESDVLVGLKLRTARQR
jgi:cytochrome P450